jgi:hypothetical protein
LSRRRGRPTYKTESQLRELVLSFIPEDGTRIRRIDVEAKANNTGLSLSTVSKYLAKLETGRTVQREVDVDARPPGVYYRRMDSKYFQGIDKSIPGATAGSPEYFEDLCPIVRASFSGFNESLSANLEKLHEMHDEEELTEKQSRLFLYYGNTFLAILSHLLEDYSCTVPPERAKSFLDEATEVLVKPMLHGVAKIFDPRLPRSKYALENMREALLEGLGYELKRFPEIRRAMAEFGRGTAPKAR